MHKQGECGALLVQGHISHPRFRFRLLPAAALVVRGRHLIMAPRPLPAAPFVVCRKNLIMVTRLLLAAPLAVRRRYLIVVPRPL